MQLGANSHGSPSKKLKTTGWEIAVTTKEVFVERICQLREMILNDTDAEVLYWQVATQMDDWHWQDLQTDQTIPKSTKGITTVLDLTDSTSMSSSTASSSSGAVPQHLSPPPGSLPRLAMVPLSSGSCNVRKVLSEEQLATVEKNRQAALQARAQKAAAKAEFEQTQAIMEGQQWMY